MAVPLISVRNKHTGAKALIPETALRHIPDFVRTAQQQQTEADATPAKAKASEPKRDQARATTKKAAPAAKNKE